MNARPSTSTPSVWSWLLALLLGLISIAVGIIVLLEPDHSLRTLAVITGVFVFVDGLVRIVVAVLWTGEDRGLVAALGIFDVVIGVLLVRHPAGGVTAVALLLGIWLIATGVLRMLAAPLTGSPLWRFVTGGVLAAAGIAIVANTDIGYTTLAVISGIGFIGYGIALVAAELDRHYVHSEAAASRRPDRSGAPAV
jgi:uncharacterized membrane protein HdeD (DUF308 family)